MNTKPINLKINQNWTETSIEIIAIEITTYKNKKQGILNVYRQPDPPVANSDKWQPILKQAIIQMEKHMKHNPWILCGDINGYHSSWGSNKDTEEGIEISKIFGTLGLIQSEAMRWFCERYLHNSLIFRQLH